MPLWRMAMWNRTGFGGVGQPQQTLSHESAVRSICRTPRPMPIILSARRELVNAPAVPDACKHSARSRLSPRRRALRSKNLVRLPQSLQAIGMKSQDL